MIIKVILLLFLIFNLSLNNKKLFLTWAVALTNLDIFYSQSSNLERIKFAFKLSKAHTHTYTHTRTHTSPLSSNSSLIRWKYKHTFQIHITHTLQNSQRGKGYVTRRTQFISFNFSWRTIISPNSLIVQTAPVTVSNSKLLFFHSQMTYQCPCNILINIDKHTLHKLEGFNIL